MTLENNEDRLLTPKETANKLNISAVTLWKLRKTGNPKFLKIGKAIRYQLSDIKKFIEEGKQ